MAIADHPRPDLSLSPHANPRQRLDELHAEVDARALDPVQALMVKIDYVLDFNVYRNGPLEADVRAQMQGADATQLQGLLTRLMDHVFPA